MWNDDDEGNQRKALPVWTDLIKDTLTPLN